MEDRLTKGKSREELLQEIENLHLQLSTRERDCLLQSTTQEPVDSLIKSAMFPIVIADNDDGCILFINDFAANYFAISMHRALDKKAEHYWKSSSQLKEFIAILEEKGRVVELEAELLTGAGAIRQVLLSARKIVYQGRNGVYTVFSDITDRKQAELALQQSEARYQKMYGMMRRMANTVPDLIWAKDLNDNYLFANRAMRQKLLMCKKGETPIGKNDLFFASRERFNGHEHTFGEICVNSDEVVKKSRKPGRFLEDGLVRGKYLALDVHKTPLFDENKAFIGTVGSGRDVTKEIAVQSALKESEHKFRLLAQNVRDVIWVSDTDFNPTYVTPSIKRLSGYSPDEFLSLPVSVHMTTRYKKKFQGLRRMMAFDIKNGKEISAKFLEFECLCKDGSPIWVEIITTAMIDSEGTLKGFTGVIRDSTKRVREQKELELAKEVALAASQTKSEFLANMSHEIRTPLNGVLGLLQLLQDTELDSVQRKYVETALGSGKSLLNLIGDILDFSKIEAGKIELRDTPFELDGLISSVVDSFESFLAQDKVTLSYEIDKSVPQVIVVDESRLRQILFNLVGNAVKFTEEGSVDILVRSERDREARNIMLFFQVRDTGRGIEAQVAEELFEPFVQEDGSVRRRHGGTGLGLSIVKELVARMGGDILLENRNKQGAQVRFTISATAGEEKVPEIAEDDTTLQQRIPAKSILVVEDEEINAMVISAMLGKLGHQVELAQNGKQALEKVKEEIFDCIFMDIQMPGMDGLETTRRLRDALNGGQSKLPIVALTAHAMKGDKDRFLAAGMDDYLSKPVEIDKILEVLRRLQDKRLFP